MKKVSQFFLMVLSTMLFSVDGLRAQCGANDTILQNLGTDQTISADGYAQSFKANCTGQINEVAIWYSEIPNAPTGAQIQLSIYEGEISSASTPIYTATINYPSSNLGLRIYDIDPPVNVVSGQTYSFAFENDFGLKYESSIANPYNNGRAFVLNGSSWTSESGEDMRFRIGFEDSQPPNAVCQDAVVVLDDTGMFSLGVSDIDGGSTDDTGISFRSVSPASFDCTSLGITTANLEVQDQNGNSDTCTANVTVLSGNYVCPSQFVTTWNTELSGATANNQIMINTQGGGYDYLVEWGDGMYDIGVTGDITHTYATPGIYTVKISGNFPRIFHSGTDDDAAKLVSVDQWGTMLWSSMDRAFAGCINMQVNATDAPDMSNVSSIERMFSGASTVNFNPIGWDLSNVTNMRRAFESASSFNGDITGWDTSSVVNMSQAFKGASSFDQEIGNWNTSQVTNMFSMFFDAVSFDQDISNWDVGNVGNMSDMFLNVTLSTINYDALLIGWSELSGLQSNVTFNAGNSIYCTGITARNVLASTPNNWNIIDGGQAISCDASFANGFITTWETTSANESITIPTTGSGYSYAIDWGDGTISTAHTGSTSHSYSTAGTYTVKIIGDFPRIYFNNTGDKLKIKSIEHWGNIEWQSMESAFRGCENMLLNATDAPNLLQVTDLSFMFRDCNLLNGDLSGWNVSNVTNMTETFRGASSFNGIISTWDVSSVVTMEFMFAFSAFNGDISNWNVSNVTNMKGTFGATPFNGIISNWNVGLVQTMQSMFANSAFNQVISGWNVGNVTDMSFMFKDTPFNKNINSWDTQNVQNMQAMFWNAQAFNTLLGGWKVGNVTNMNHMFGGASSFNQNLGGWNVSRVTDVERMFENATAFDRDLSNWDISSLQTAEKMFDGAGLSQTNYDNLLIGWSILGVDETQIPIALNFSALNTNYCLAQEEREALINTYGWTITDAGQSCDATFNNGFITTWATTTSNETITVPISLSDGTANYNIDWGDGTIETGLSASASHTYTAIGTWTVRIIGELPRITFSSSGVLNRARIRSIEQWGDIQWRSMELSYVFCENLVVNATDSPNLDAVVNMNGMFLGSPLINADFGNWDVSSVANMNSMFNGVTSFDQDLGNWDISSLTDAENMFNGVTLSIENYDSLLLGWSTLNTAAGETQIPSNISFNAGNSNYCLGEPAREELINAYNWEFSDGNLECPDTIFDNAFITTWETTANGESITIPTFLGETYYYRVDWGDGSFDINVTGSITHTYSDSQVYTVKIVGTFPRIYFNNSGDKDKIKTIEQWGNISWNSMEDAFNGCINLISNAADRPDLTQVTSLREMFRNTVAFNGDAQMNTWDVSNITDMSMMFRKTESFNRDISSWNTSNVTTIFGMFRDALAFNQDIGNWDMENVTSISAMFRGAEAFNQDISGWNFNTLTIADNVFMNAMLFNQDISNWNVSNVTTMAGMFSGATAFDQDLGHWDISALTDATNMFVDANLSVHNYDNLLIGWSTLTATETQIPVNLVFNAGNSSYCLGEMARNRLLTSPFNWTITDSGVSNCVSTFNDAFITTWLTTSENENITIPTNGNGEGYTVDWGDGTIETGLSGNATHTYTIAGTYTIKIIGNFTRIYFNNAGHKDKILTIEQWGDIKWINFARAFYGCSNIVSNATDTPDLSLVTDMFRMFKNTDFFNGDPGINTWDVSNVTNMEQMFDEALAFNTNINQWDVSNVTNFKSMFEDTEIFNQDLNNWNVSAAINMKEMFREAKSFNGDISSWNVSNVTDMSEMFLEAPVFNQDIGSWNVSNVTDMSKMFEDAISFNQDIGNWDVSNVTNMRNMFWNVPTFNQDISNWNVSQVADMEHMFDGATAFNQDIGNWDVSNVTGMDYMFRGAIAFNQNIGNWNTANCQDMLRMFEDAISFNQDIGNWDVSKVEYMNNMFEGAREFNQDIGNWNTVQNGNFSKMFRDAISFNQDIGNWDVSNAYDMDNMFKNAEAFDQDLGGWDISNAPDMEDMFLDAGLSTPNYDATLMGWNTLDVGETEIPINRNFNAGNSIYCLSEAARTNLINTYGWTITDEGSCSDTAEGFITTWKTDNPGSSNDNQITIDTQGTGLFYAVDWGDGSTDVGVTGDITHTYAIAGTYTISIMGEFSIVGTGTNDADKLLSIEQWGKVHWLEMVGAFRNCNNLVINATDAPDLSKVTNLAFMFLNAERVNADFNNWDVSGITNMERMFQGAHGFNGDIQFWHVQNVTNMDRMFNGAQSFNSNIANWDVSNVTNMDRMFLNASAFNRNIGKWDITNVTNMNDMLVNVALGTPNYDGTLIGWQMDTSGIPDDGIDDIPNAITFSGGNSTYCLSQAQRQVLIDTYNWVITDAGLNSNCDQLFDDAFITTWDAPIDKLTINIPIETYYHNYGFTIDWGDGTVEIGLGSDDTDNIYHTYQTPGTYTVKITGDFPKIDFEDETVAPQILTVQQWGNIQWESMEDAFYGCTNLTIAATDTPDLSRVTNMSFMFRDATAINTGLSAWNTNNIELMEGTFWGATSFNGDITNWNVSNVTNMSDMFRETPFNQNIGSWNVSNAIDMEGMLRSTTAFDQDIGNWNTSNVTTMEEMFKNSEAFNQDIGNWDTSNVTTMKEMFQDALVFNQDIGGWNTSKVTNMDQVFFNAIAFNQDIGNWDTSMVTTMFQLFEGAAKFNQDIGNWDVGNVTLMLRTFTNASAFNQDLGNWDIAKVNNMGSMLTNSGLSVENYDNTLIGWYTDTSGAIDGIDDVPSDIVLNATNLHYCLSAIQRQDLIDTYNWSIDDAGLNCGVVLSAKVYLQGAALNPNMGEEHLMRDDLRAAGLLPTISPYPDTISCDESVPNTEGSDAIVDWIWLELRDADDNSKVIAGRSALVQRDGDIVGVDGRSSVRIEVFPGDYHVVVGHRNHLTVMTEVPQALDDIEMEIDLTDVALKVYGENARTDFGMPSGTLGLWAGDANQDGKVIFLNTGAESVDIKQLVLDRSIIESPFGASVFYKPQGYYDEDLDMDGEVIFLNAGNELQYVKDNILSHPGNQIFNSVFFTISGQLP